MKQHTGLYRAVVVDNNDPETRLRLKVRVPGVTGDAVVGWAWPCLPPVSDRSMLAAPAPGSGVWVTFEGGDPDFPIWTGVF